MENLYSVLQQCQWKPDLFPDGVDTWADDPDSAVRELAQEAFCVFAVRIEYQLEGMWQNSHGPEEVKGKVPDAAALTERETSIESNLDLIQSSPRDNSQTQTLMVSLEGTVPKPTLVSQGSHLLRWGFRLKSVSGRLDGK